MLHANGHLLLPGRQPSTYCSLRTVASTSWTCTPHRISSISAYHHLGTCTLLDHELTTLRCLVGPAAACHRVAIQESIFAVFQPAHMQGSLWQRFCPQAPRDAAAGHSAPAVSARLAGSQRSQQISHGASRRQRRAGARQQRICASLRGVQSEGELLRQHAAS